MLSNTCKYALRSLIYLATFSGPNKLIGIKKISKDLKLSPFFLGKILQNLVKKEILVSTKGPHGGFTLAQSAKEITLYDIVINVDGKKFFTTCMIGLEPCHTYDPEKPLCPVHAQYDKLRKKIIKFYKETSLALISKDIEKYEDIMKY
jgi:Rrf2 family transcriptional regulator, iron-sulfur cluster assembly transcription factor